MARDLPVLRRPLVAGLLLLVAYAGLSTLSSSGGYLGTDTGAKVATLDVMARRGTAAPVLGYWAEDLDPKGDLHPVYQAAPVDGDWVAVTTLPMLELARPLWDIGGYKLTLLLPMLGAVGAAFAARSIARRAADDRVGWQAFWLVGLGSPIVVYALDLWEHAPGVACMAGAVALLAGVVDGEELGWRALGAGALLGLAATMRTESFVYALLAVGGAGLVLFAQDRRVGRALRVGVISVLGFLVPWAANAVLERAVGGLSRGTRSSGAASSGLDRLGDRVSEGITALVAVRPGELTDVLLFGGVAAALVVGAIVMDRRGDERIARLLLVAAAVIHVSAMLGGLDFVPGLVAAAPIALAALVVLPVGVAPRYVLGVAVTAIPLVVAFQYLGGAGPQWAGRYTLTSCTLLVALGVVAVTGLSSFVRIGLVVLTIAVSASGVLWLGERSREVDRLFDELVDRPEDVVVVRNGFFIREGGDAYSERLWLTAVTDRDLSRAVDVVRESGHDTFAVLDENPSAPATLNGSSLVETVETSVVGMPLYLHSYRL